VPSQCTKKVVHFGNPVVNLKMWDNKQYTDVFPLVVGSLAASMHVEVQHVKRRLSNLFQDVSLRTLFAIAHYHHIPLSHRLSKKCVSELIANKLVEHPLMPRLRRLLDPSDLALLEQLSHDSIIELPTGTRFPWQLSNPWPPLASLQPLERLMVLGVVLPMRNTARVKLVLPANIIQIVQGLYILPSIIQHPLPPGPSLATLVDDAVTILALLAASPAPHRPTDHWPAAFSRRLLGRCCQDAPTLERKTQHARLLLLHRLLHQAGYLEIAGERCSLSPWAPLFLGGEPDEQLRVLLETWAKQPLATSDIPAGVMESDVRWPIVIAWLFERLHEIGLSAVPLSELLAAWADHYESLLHPPFLILPPGLAQPPASAGKQLIKALLRGPLHQLGMLQTDGVFIAVSEDGLTWMQGAIHLPERLPLPPLDGLSLHLPPLAPATLRFKIEQWAEHRSAKAHRYAYVFTEASLRKGIHVYGSPKPLLTLLRRYYRSIPQPLLALTRQSSKPAPLQLRAGMLLQADDPATLNTVIQQRSLRRYLGPRLGRHTVLVRQQDEQRLRRALMRRGLLDADTLPSGTGADQSHSAFHLILALRLAAPAAPLYAPSFMRLAREWSAQLSPAQRAELDDLWQSLANDAPASERSPNSSEPCSVLDRQVLCRILQTALENGSTVEISYYSAGRRAITWRRVRPLVLQRDYLTAFCFHANDERVFRLDRILELTDETIASPTTD
jgi:hypothetical protein